MAYETDHSNVEEAEVVKFIDKEWLILETYELCTIGYSTENEIHSNLSYKAIRIVHIWMPLNFDGLGRQGFAFGGGGGDLG